MSAAAIATGRAARAGWSGLVCDYKEDPMTRACPRTFNDTELEKLNKCLPQCGLLCV
jgi:hypothetical protein